jgi:CHAD domain-containing protein
MAYRFKLNERAGKALLRTGTEQLQRALASLDAADRKTGIHGTRKCIKRMRSLLRLARPGLDKSAYQRLNDTLRDAGRTLSAARDRDVLLATVSDISARSPELRPTLRHVSSAIGPADDPATSKMQAAMVRKARDLVQTAADEWQHLALADDAFETLAEGLKRGMRDLAEAFDATESGDEEAFHDLRKAVQRHWRHMRLVEAGWPAYFVARAEESKAISELLGKAQDLTLLLHHLRDTGSVAPPDADEVRQAVEHRRATLQEAARSRTQRLLAEGPRAHARRATEYWTAANALRKANRNSKAEMPAAKAADPGSAGDTNRPPPAAGAPRKRSAAAKPPPGERSSKRPAKRPARKPSARDKLG